MNIVGVFGVILKRVINAYTVENYKKMVEWIPFASGKKVCRCHYKEICPSYPTANTKVSKKVHEQSRTITNKPRRVIVERFHSYRVKFVAVVDWDSLFQFPEFSLNNNVKFKRIDLSKAIVKVFRKSILITLRASCDVKGLPVKEAKLLSDSIVAEVLTLLPKGIRVSDSVVSSVHNAFMNHPTARHNITVSVNGEKRLICDNSHGVSEFEAIHPKFALSDSEALECDNEALIDRGLSRDVLANSIKVLIDNHSYYAENLKSHVLAIRELAFMIRRLNNRGKSL